MSREMVELRRLAHQERQVARASAKRLPARLGDAASAFVRQHPVMAMGGATAIAMGFMARARRGSDGPSHSTSLPMALAAIGVPLLLDALQLAGLAVPKQLTPAEPAEPAEPIETQPADASRLGA